jgi:hypothetical protein
VCSHLLFEFDEIPFDPTWYPKLRHNLTGKCEKCGHKLPSISQYVKKLKFEAKSAVPILSK